MMMRMMFKLEDDDDATDINGGVGDLRLLDKNSPSAFSVVIPVMK